jgi:hypothetical protein
MAASGRPLSATLSHDPGYDPRTKEGSAVLILKFLHIASMFAAVTLLFATDLLFYRAMRRGDIAGLRSIARHGHAVTNVGVGLAVLGIIFGFATALTGGFDLLAPWLLIAYVLVVALVILGAAVEGPFIERVGRAAEASEGGTASEELHRLLADRRGEVALALSAVLYVAVIYVMVVKPFS